MTTRITSVTSCIQFFLLPSPTCGTLSLRVTSILTFGFFELLARTPSNLIGVLFSSWLGFCSFQGNILHNP